MKQKQTIYPHKTTINMVIKEKSDFRMSRSLPLMALVVAAVLLFGKFAVADQLAKVYDEQKKLAAVQDRLDGLQAELSNFQEVSDLHSRYASGWMTDEEKALPDRLSALNLIDETLMPKAAVKGYAVEGNLISVSLSGLSLADISRLLQQLSASPLVQDADVFTASNQVPGGTEAGLPANPADSTVSLLITLCPPVEGGDAP